MLYRELNKDCGFRLIEPNDFQKISGGHLHEDPLPDHMQIPDPNSGINDRMNDLLNGWGMLNYDQYDPSVIDLGGGISVSVDPLASNVSVNGQTSLGLVSLNFNLSDFSIPTVTFTTPDFSITGNVESESLSGTFNVDFGGGVTGTFSGSASSSGSFSLSTGFRWVF